MQMDRVAQFKGECVHHRVNPCGQVSAGSKVIRFWFNSYAFLPPFSGPQFHPVVGSTPIDVGMIGDAMNPRPDGGPPTEPWQCLPYPAKSTLRQISGVRFISSEPA